MNPYDIERDLSAWFDTIEPRGNFDHVLANVFRVSRSEAQRPALFARLATRTPLGMALPATHVGFRIALAMLALLLALLGVALAAGALIPPPPRIDGAIAVERWAVGPGVWPEDAGPPPRIVTLLLPDGTLSPITPDDRDEACPAFSPDGSRVALLSARRESEGSDPTYQLAVTEPRAGAERVLLAPGFRAPQPSFTAPSWAPDGSAVAAILRGPDQPLPIGGDLLLVPVDGSPARTIIRNARVAEGQRPPPGMSGLEGASWSPDGRWIALRAELHDEQGWSYVIAVVRADGTDLRVLDTWEPSGSLEWGGVIWSPDSQWVAYHRRPPGANSGPMDAYAASIAGDMVRRLTASATNEFVAEWSPDGTRITTVGLSQWPAQIIDFASGHASALALPPGSSGATWSADGERLAVLQEERLWMLSSDGTAAPKLLLENATSLCGGMGSGISWQELPQ